MESLKVAVLGAGGFIGSRVVEVLHLEGLAEVRPVVRHLASLACLSRFDLDWRIANGFDKAALRLAFQGCDIVVDAIAGDHKTILDTLVPIYRAAQEAGIRRIVYLSSASVHGQTPVPGTNENSTLSTRQPLIYNKSRVQAERKLMSLRRQGTVEVAILRPGIVFGPRSRWCAGLADELLAGTAYFVNGGRGICNSLYVDNLVHAIFLAMTTPGADHEAFLLGDDELVTWSDLYRPIAEALGINVDLIPRVRAPEPGNRLLNLLPVNYFEGRAEILASRLPKRLKTVGRTIRSAWQSLAQPTPQDAARHEKLAVTREMALLQQCQYKLPCDKARRVLGYKAVVSFSEACRRSIAWLAFAGYPVLDSWK